MTKGVFAQQPDDPLEEAVRQMVERKVGSVVIEEPKGYPVGILTQSDVLRGIIGGFKPNQTCRGVMSTELLTISPTADLGDALELMREAKVKHLVVVDGEGRTAGMLSMADVLFSAQSESDLSHIMDYLAELKKRYTNKN